MKFKFIFYLFFALFVFNSCIIQDVPEISIEDIIPEEYWLYNTVQMNDPVIFSKDSLIDIPIEKSIILKSDSAINNYAYADIIPLSNDGQLLLVTTCAPVISDYAPGYLVYSLSYDFGETWSSPTKLEDDLKSDYINISHPSLIRISENHLMLFYGVKYSATRIDQRFKQSFDNGKTWEVSQLVFGDKKGYQVSNNARVTYQNGRIILPLSIPTNKIQTNIRTSDDFGVFYYFSDDNGKTWSRSNLLINTEFGLLEPGLTPLSKSEYLMNIRTNRGTVLFARSLDAGDNWDIEVSDIKSTDSPQTLYYSDNNLFMVWNRRINTNIHSGARNILSFTISYDKGKNWRYLFDIENNRLNYSYASFTEDRIYFYITYYKLIYDKYSSLKLVKIKKSNLLN